MAIFEALQQHHITSVEDDSAHPLPVERWGTMHSYQRPEGDQGAMLVQEPGWDVGPEYEVSASTLKGRGTLQGVRNSV